MCNMKSVLKLGAVMGILLIFAYATFPEFRAGIALVAPFLLWLACPAAMYFMMKGMNNQNQQSNDIAKGIDLKNETK
jgi:tryptophan-rich sensory protein